MTTPDSDITYEIPFNRPSFPPAAMEYVQDAVGRGMTAGNGPNGREAQRLLRALHGDDCHVLLTTSGTHALEMSGRLLDLSPGDEVIVPAYTFVSTASAYVWNGARPVFADIRPDTLNIDPASVERMVGPRTRAICIVHYGGVAAEPEVFRDMAQRHGLTLIEDNAHGLGARSATGVLGTHGQMSALSFHETKNVNCGEGGALVVNDVDLVDRAEILREKGTNRLLFQQGRVDKYTWVDVGSSWVMSDLLAGVLRAQLERFDAIQETRHEIWRRYRDGLGHWAEATGVTLPHIPDGVAHSAHMFHLRLPTRERRDAFIAHMRERGILCVFHYQPLSTSAAAQRMGLRSDEIPNSIRAADTLVRLPFYDTLDAVAVGRVIEAAVGFDRVGR